MTLDTQTLTSLKDIGGEAGCIIDPERMAPYMHDVRGVAAGCAAAVLRPASTDEVSRMVRVCGERGIAMVPHGGNTGYMGGSIPDDSGRQVVISLARLNRIRELDARNFTLTAEAGCILENLHKAAEEAERLFPLSLGAQGSCQIGGNLSTNAGGTNVLRYGNARDLVLGLEVVLPDGRVWHGLRGLRKDNTGYNLKQLFLGAEGTLGIITAAVLKLFPLPRHTAVAMAAVHDPAAAVDLLTHLRASTGDLVSGFEYMHSSVLEMARKHLPDTPPPLAGYEHVVLLEISGGSPEMDLDEMTEQALAAAFEQGWVLDAMVATSLAQQNQFWHIREHLPEAQKREGERILFDVSVPVSAVPEFLERAAGLVHAVREDVLVSPFGHVGDGNIHFDLVQPAALSREDFLALSPAITDAVNDLIAELGGSFSAEHGIGRIKLGSLARYRDPVEIELMRRIKEALDPHGLMNPGKILPEPA